MYLIMLANSVLIRELKYALERAFRRLKAIGEAYKQYTTGHYAPDAM